MKSIVLILPYFGKFNNYFDNFLISCRCNPTIDWLIYTDDQEKYNYPSNVHVKYIKFEEFVEKFQKKLGKDIYLETPYKLCDFKITYGYVLQEDIKKRSI